MSKHFLVRAKWGVVDKSDEFIKNNYWIHGNPSNDKSLLAKIETDDWFVLAHDAHVKAIGQVKEKPVDYGDGQKIVKIKSWFKENIKITKPHGYQYTNTIDLIKSDFYDSDGFKQVRQRLEKMKKNMEEIIKLLKFKNQIILQGPPGTGKTRLAKEIAEELTKNNNPKEKDSFVIVQFHPAYTYEDFVRGIVAKTDNGQVSYNVENKVLAKIAEEAEKDENKEKNYVLIIDEINRANLPAVLGELIYALEYRGKGVTSMYEKEGSGKIKLPENLYIIGTMNTADRTVGHIDYAIRRRFAFVDVSPKESVIKNEKAKILFGKIKELFDEHISSDFKINDVMIGHSYFIKDGDFSDEELKLKLKYEIKPILREYLKDGILKKEAEEKIKDLNV